MHSLDHVGIRISQQSVYSLLRVCIEKKDLEAGRQVHFLINHNGLDPIALLGDHLIRLYAACGSLLEASNVFWRVSTRSVYTWNAIIGAYARHGEGFKALELYHKMQQLNIASDIVTDLHALKACANAGMLFQGRLIHDHAISIGLDLDTVGNSLIDMYTKCGSLLEARCVFDGLTKQTVVSWGAMIGGYVENGQCLYALELVGAMRQHGHEPNRVIFLCILKACINLGNISEARLVHDQVVRSGLDSELTIGNTLIDMYAKFGDLKDSCLVFEKLPNQDVVSWDAWIAGCSQSGNGFFALELFEKMLQRGLEPDKYTYSCILSTCANEGALAQGKLVHDLVIKYRLESHVVVGNTLIDMYARCGCVMEAYIVFCGLPTRDVVSWGTMISRCVENNLGLFALQLSEDMQQEGILPNKAILLSFLKACILEGDLVQGRVVHDWMIRNGLEIDIISGSTLVDMYAKQGSLEEAGKTFANMKSHNEVAWGLMIAGHIQHGHCLEAVEIYEKMQEIGIKLDKVSLLCMLKACIKLGSITLGKILHDKLIKSKLESDVEVQSSIIDMYAKCGSLGEAYYLLHQSPKGDAVSWGAVIAAFARYGHCEMAWECLVKMQSHGLRPDSVIFMNILNACSNAGLIGKGCDYFSSMGKYPGMVPKDDDYNSMVDLLGRAGQLKEAEDLLRSMPIGADIVGWISLLSCCRIYRHIELGRQCFDQIMQLDPDDPSGYMLMASIYYDAHKWEDYHYIQELQLCHSIVKKAGISSIEIDHQTHNFMVGDRSHCLYLEIEAKCKRLNELMKTEGLVPQQDLMPELQSDLSNHWKNQHEEESA